MAGAHRTPDMLIVAVAADCNWQSPPFDSSKDMLDLRTWLGLQNQDSLTPHVALWHAHIGTQSHMGG